MFFQNQQKKLNIIQNKGQDLGRGRGAELHTSISDVALPYFRLATPKLKYFWSANSFKTGINIAYQ